MKQKQVLLRALGGVGCLVIIIVLVTELIVMPPKLGLSLDMMGIVAIIIILLFVLALAMFWLPSEEGDRGSFLQETVAQEEDTSKRGVWWWR